MEIVIQSKKGRRIIASMPAEDPPFKRAHAVQLFKERHPNATLRSISSTYNCVGLALAARRAVVSAYDLPSLLEDDGFVKVPEEKVQVGDLVVYVVDGQMEHVGIVVHRSLVLTPRDHSIKLISKWGFLGEYIHDIEDVPAEYGNNWEFWSERQVP
jgi:hypothetical protein